MIETVRTRTTSSPERSWDAVIDVSRQPAHVAGALEALSATSGHWVFVSTGNVYADASRLDGDESDPLLEPLPVDQPPRPRRTAQARWRAS